MAVTIRVRGSSNLKGNEADDHQQNVEFMNNPARFSDVYRFRVTFECIAPLEDGELVFSYLNRVS
jgi:hypothetical protein